MDNNPILKETVLWSCVYVFLKKLITQICKLASLYSYTYAEHPCEDSHYRMIVTYVGTEG